MSGSTAEVLNPIFYLIRYVCGITVRPLKKINPCLSNDLRRFFTTCLQLKSDCVLQGQCIKGLRAWASDLALLAREWDSHTEQVRKKVNEIFAEKPTGASFRSSELLHQSRLSSK